MRAAAAAERVGPVAAIDCGTNSTRLLVLGEDGSRLARQMRITRLGAGVDRTGALDRAAIERTLAVLGDYRKLLDEHGVSPRRARAAATSATRDASNSAEFLDAAEKILGVRPEVIEGVEEGRLSYVGATASLDPAEGPYLVVDIGGGSTELIVGREDAEPSATPAAVVSLDIGCVRVTERYLESDPPTPDEIAAARADIRERVRRVRRVRENEAAWRRGRRLIGLAGTVSALTVMVLGLDAFDEDRVHHARVTRLDLGAVTERVAAVPLAERKRLRGMEVERADVIVGGALVLEEVMDVFGFGELTASESDILDGIAFELLAAGAAGG